MGVVDHGYEMAVREAAMRFVQSLADAQNGLALCKIHHAAYDQDILGISPDRVVHINSDVLAERDGPMLRHGLQEFHRAALRVVPSRAVDQPDPDRLAERFARFEAAS